MQEKDFVDGNENLPTDDTHNGNAMSQGMNEAVNEETGEINWDCPCLKSALQPPCGEAFKAAFSCFIKSTAEPKGSDCFEAFAVMRDCFLAHPEVYGRDDEEDGTSGVEGKKEDALEGISGRIEESLETDQF